MEEYVLNNTQQAYRRKQIIELQIQRLSNEYKVGNRILLWKIYIKPQIEYILPLVFTQNKGMRKNIEALWKQSLKRVLNLPKHTDDSLLIMIQGSCLDIALEKQWQTSLKCQYRYGIEPEEYEFKAQNKVKNTGIMNLPTNLGALFQLNLRRCKTHPDLRCGIEHIKREHGIQLLQEIQTAISTEANINTKLQLEKRINEILQQVEGDFLSSD